MGSMTGKGRERQSTPSTSDAFGCGGAFRTGGGLGVGDSSGEGQEEGAVLVPGVGPVRGLVRPLALLLGLGLAWGAVPGRRGHHAPTHPPALGSQVGVGVLALHGASKSAGG